MKTFLAISFLLFTLTISAQKIWTLKECIDTALYRNITINKNILSSNVNAIYLHQSKSANLPNLNFGDNQAYNSGFSLDPYTNQYTTQNINANTANLTSTVTLFNGYLLINTVKQCQLLYYAGEYDIQKARNDITLAVLAGYMQILMDYEAIDAAQAQILSTQTQVEETQKFVKFGKVAPLNLLQIESQLAADKLLKVTAENQLQLDKLSLLQLMEIPVQEDFDVQLQQFLTIKPTVPAQTNEINTAAISFLPEVQSAALRKDAARYSLKIARSGYYPKLTFNVALKTGYSSIRTNSIYDTSYLLSTIGYVKGDQTLPVTAMLPVVSNNRQVSNLTDQLKNNFSQSLGLTLSVPIFNNRSVKTAVDIASANIATAMLNEQQVRNDIRKSIETVYTNQIAAGKKLIAVEEQMDMETRTYSDMKKKYGFGASSITDFLIEVNNFNKVFMQLIQAKYDYILKTKLIDFYLHKPLTF